jgi:hypothetical protein
MLKSYLSTKSTDIQLFVLLDGLNFVVHKHESYLKLPISLTETKNYYLPFGHLK